MSPKFPPHMTLQAAARNAAKRGMELRVKWNGIQCEVEMVRPFNPAELPSFLRPHCDAILHGS